ncbi:MAG TPA: hypothetical protein VMS99_07895 [Acidimicrobiia bacterium]|nr:hypothetical protein [Acidimicrobiia bacterium]
MSRFDDYPGDMFATTVTDEDIELLLAGSAPANQELAELAAFVDLIRATSVQMPSESQIVEVASQAATIARSTAPSTGARRRVRSRARVWWRWRPQVALTLGAVLVTFTFAGVATASNNAAPGDALYAIDLALERIGIGAGHVEERLDEANALLSSGKTDLALAHAAQAIDLSTADSDEVAALEEAKAALIEAAELIDAGPGTDALLMHENVSALLVFIHENHQMTGVDKKEFGQRVAALAREISTQQDTTGPPDEVEVDEPEDPGRAGDVGEPAKSEPGPPVNVPRGESPPANNAGNGNPEPENRGETGNPTATTSPGSNQGGGSAGTGGPPAGSPSETAPGGSPPAGSPSETAPGKGKP